MADTVCPAVLGLSGSTAFLQSVLCNLSGEGLRMKNCVMDSFSNQKRWACASVATDVLIPESLNQAPLQPLLPQLICNSVELTHTRNELSHTSV